MSPSNKLDQVSASLSSFNRQQIEYLQERILSDQERITELDSAINRASTEDELASLRDEKTALEKSISERQQAYLGLAALLDKNTMPNSLTVIEPAQASNYRIRPRVELNTILSGLLGLVLAFVLVFVLDYLDDTINSLDDFHETVNLPLLGVIGKIHGKNNTDKLITKQQMFSSVAESYRMIRSRIGFKFGDAPKKAIAVVSAMPGEGKSITAANLAIAMAQAGMKTILVDNDLRRPVIHQLFNVENAAGMADLLISQKIKVKDCLLKTQIDNLQILPSGKRIPDTTERLSTRRLSEVIAQLKDASDVVIFDSPPALLVADTSLLCNQVDGVILVVRAGKSKRRQVKQAISDLERAEANLMGCIVNQPVKNGSFDSYKSYNNAS
jgi:capsular exopolysaccharide synthesis family protein